MRLKLSVSKLTQRREDKMPPPSSCLCDFFGVPCIDPFQSRYFVPGTTVTKPRRGLRLRALTSSNSRIAVNSEDLNHMSNRGTRWHNYRISVSPCLPAL